MYLDEGSEGIEIYENVVGPNVYWWSSIWTTSIKNNHWHDNYHQVENERDNGTNNVVENNTHIPDGDFSKYPKAQQIIDNAGLLDESVKTGVATGSEKKHQVRLTEYENTPSYYFTQEDGLTSFVLKNQIGNTQYNRRTRVIDILMPEGTDVSDLEATLDKAIENPGDWTEYRSQGLGWFCHSSTESKRTAGNNVPCLYQ